MGPEENNSNINIWLPGDKEISQLRPVACRPLPPRNARGRRCDHCAHRKAATGGHPTTTSRAALPTLRSRDPRPPRGPHPGGPILPERPRAASRSRPRQPGSTGPQQLAPTYCSVRGLGRRHSAEAQQEGRASPRPPRPAGYAFPVTQLLSPAPAPVSRPPSPLTGRSGRANGGAAAVARPPARRAVGRPRPPRPPSPRGPERAAPPGPSPHRRRSPAASDPAAPADVAARGAGRARAAAPGNAGATPPFRARVFACAHQGPPGAEAAPDTGSLESPPQVTRSEFQKVGIGAWGFRPWELTSGLTRTTPEARHLNFRRKWCHGSFRPRPPVK
ncbi:translation initiation factor IF-2-like [Sorex fumeus]|uniref:translation initiation factor IF-2-like n=1 Tax=Sorex fumeus TaxID=62283 RepID=UPI0024AE801F|nr:translation initiation factor IF-2-like [Sorex fumeus]